MGLKEIVGRLEQIAEKSASRAAFEKGSLEYVSFKNQSLGFLKKDFMINKKILSQNYNSTPAIDIVTTLLEYSHRFESDISEYVNALVDFKEYNPANSMNKVRFKELLKRNQSKLAGNIKDLCENKKGLTKNRNIGVLDHLKDPVNYVHVKGEDPEKITIRNFRNYLELIYNKLPFELKTQREIENQSYSLRKQRLKQEQLS